MEMTEVRLPRLLGPEMAEKARLRPSKASATANLSPLSKASLTLPEGEESVGIRDFVEVYGPEGSLGIYRAASVQTTYGNQQQVSLEHGLVTLEDDLVSTETVISGSVRDALSTLLGFQSKTYWMLGSVDVDGNITETDLTMSNLLEAVLAVVGSDETAMITFDQSAFPWVIHVRRKPDTPSCECRLNRNLNSVNIRLDDSSLCTRVTAQDADGDLYTYTADTAGTWGIVHKTIMLEEGGDPAAVAQKYLNDYKNPTVSVELDALELAKRTGETLDKFVIGTVCRTALPEWGVSVDERIVSLTYPDLFGQPELVRLTLSNSRRDASTQLSGLRNTALSNTQSIIQNSRGIARNLKYYHELDDLAQIQAKHIELLGEDIKLRATKDELGKYLNEVWIDMDATKATVEIHAQHIDKNTHDITAAGTRIDGINATLTDYAGKFDAQGNLISGAELRLNGLEAAIDLKVNKDGLISAINLSPEQIRIASSKVVLDGYVTASQLEVTNATITNLMAGRETATSIVTDSIGINSHLAFLGHQADWYSRSFGTSLTAAAERVVQRENITYIGTDGQSHFVSVVTGITNLNSQPTLNTTTYRFLGFGN